MSSYHEQLMSEYYAAREAQEIDAEYYGIGYATETQEYYAYNPRVTFKEFLIGRKGNKDEPVKSTQWPDTDYERWMLAEYDKSVK